MGKQGILLDPKDHNLARQNPADHLYGLEASIKGALKSAGRKNGFSAEEGDRHRRRHDRLEPDSGRRGQPPAGPEGKVEEEPRRPMLALEGPYQLAGSRPDHRAGGQAQSAIHRQMRRHLFLRVVLVKDLALPQDRARRLRRRPSWVELCDWIPAVLAGVTDPLAVMRGVCAPATRRCMRRVGRPARQGIPATPRSEARRTARPPLRKGARRPTSRPASLCAEWAQKIGLPAGIPIAIGEFDVHYGAIGCGVAEGVLVKVIGTSTCDCAVISADKEVADIPGICGIVKGAILPGYYGIEAGQSAVGDIFKWWVEVVCEGDDKLHAKLTRQAAKLTPGQSGLLALDWNNGNRTILVDPMLSGLLLGQTLHTSQAEIYRALIEATAFGARAIIERIKEYGVPVGRIVCAGGIAEKNPHAHADLCRRHRLRHAGRRLEPGLRPGFGRRRRRAGRQSQGRTPHFKAAQKAMTAIKDIQYKPIKANQTVYDQVYPLYRQIHDAFGGVAPKADLGRVMKELLAIKEAARPEYNSKAQHDIRQR